MKGVVARLSARLEDPAISGDTLLWARTLEILGEQYYRISDIDEAKRLWDLASDLRHAAFGNDSPEAGVALAWNARYHNYMAAPQWDHQATAEANALRAVQLIEDDPRVLPMERVIALRERAYAYKVFHGLYALQRAKDSPAEPSAAARPYFRKALHEAIVARDTIWIAQILHDIGNTFTDQSIPSRDDPAKLQMVVDSAMWYYARSIALMQAHGLGISEPVMMDHLTMGLLQRYAYGANGCTKAIHSYRNALHVLLAMQKIPGDAELFVYHPEVPNKAQVLELMSFIAHAYHILWYEDTNSGYIDSAVNVIEHAVPYWEGLVKEYNSKKLHLVTSSYAHSPFEYAQRFYIDRYVYRRDDNDLIKALTHLERRRSVNIQRDRLLRGLPPLPILGSPITMEHLVAPEGTLILEYLSGKSLFVVVIDNDGPELFDLGVMPYNAEFGVGKFDRLPVNEISSDRPRYRKLAKEWYDRLLRQALQGRKEKKLVIIPYGTLSHLPFGALLCDTMGQDLFVAQEYEIRNSPDLRSALRPMRTVDRSVTVTMASDPHRSALPFALRSALTLADVFGAELDTALTTDRFDRLLRMGGILHLASHASAERAPDTDPYIVLHDRPWSLKDVPWNHVERDLIVLAACASGSGRFFLGEGAQSIGHALLQAGAGAVVHTLWPVDDRSTNEILQHMYEAMLEGEPASTALHRAKNKFINEHREDGLDDPFYWSGIVLAGRDVAIERARPSLWWAIIPITLLTVIAIDLYNRSRSSRARALN